MIVYDAKSLRESKDRRIVCKDCGKNKAEVKFYPSRKDRCAPCIIKRNAENSRPGSPVKLFRKNWNRKE